MSLSTYKIFKWQNLVVFLIILFCIRYIPLETRGGPSMIKTGVSFFCLLLLVLRPLYLSKGFLLTMLYFLIVFSCTYMLHPETFRWSTLLYLLSFLIVFVTFYNLVVCEQCLSYDVFLKLVKGLLIAFAVVLFLQQMLLIVGIRNFPLLNLSYYLGRGIGANSLGGEPSSVARIMSVLFLALIRLLEIKYNRPLSLQDIFSEARWPVIAFLWTMVTMMSGTAFVGLALLSLYFVRRQSLLVVILVGVVFIIVVPYIEFEPLQRAYRMVTAFLTTGDQDAVMKADGSGGSRAIVLINTFTELDYSNLNAWIGHGVDYTKSFGGHQARLQVAVIGNINEYGLISFIVMQIIVYSCIIRRFFSLETLLWIFLFNMTFGNIAYAWGAVMVFSGVRYFQTNTP